MAYCQSERDNLAKHTKDIQCISRLMIFNRFSILTYISCHNEWSHSIHHQLSTQWVSSICLIVNLCPLSIERFLFPNYNNSYSRLPMITWLKWEKVSLQLEAAHLFDQIDWATWFRLLYDFNFAVAGQFQPRHEEVKIKNYSSYNITSLRRYSN